VTTKIVKQLRTRPKLKHIILIEFHNKYLGLGESGIQDFQHPVLSCSTSDTVIHQ